MPRLCMSSQLFGASERCTTLATHTRLVSGMYPLVFLQTTGPRERRTTLAAHVWFNSGVCPHVKRQTARLFERRAALGTHIGSLVCVNSGVFLQTTGPGEGRAALLADVGTQAGVELCVLQQSRVLRERGPAVFTHVRLVKDVCSDVQHQVLGQWEGGVAGLAGVGSVAHVRLHVGVEMPCFAERGPAFRADACSGARFVVVVRLGVAVQSAGPREGRVTHLAHKRSVPSV